MLYPIFDASRSSDSAKQITSDYIFKAWTALPSVATVDENIDTLLNITIEINVIAVYNKLNKSIQ